MFSANFLVRVEASRISEFLELLNSSDEYELLDEPEWERCSQPVKAAVKKRGFHRIKVEKRFVEPIKKLEKMYDSQSALCSKALKQGKHPSIPGYSKETVRRIWRGAYD